jgi:catechol 2,3-dioxygenase-like lactoylglutathione lyase family enzyme
VVDADETWHTTSVVARSDAAAAAWQTRRVRAYETVLYATDIPAAAAFYSDVLGLRLVDGPDELAAAFRLEDGGVLLLFNPERSTLPGRPVPSHGTTGAGHLAFSVESLDSWEQRFAGAGVEIELDKEWPQGGRSLYVRDPAGNSVELVEGDIWPA